MLPRCWADVGPASQTVDQHLTIRPTPAQCIVFASQRRARILVQVTIYRRLRIGRDDHLDQSEAYGIS